MEIKVVSNAGQLVTDSRDVAKMTGKEHKELLRTIRGFISILTSANLRSSDFFIHHGYEDAKREYRPCFLLTKKGCDMVANKMTGGKGILFTAAFVTKFDEMERNIHLPNVLLDNEQLTAKMLETTKELEFMKEEFKVLHEKVDNQITLDYGQQRLLQQLISKKVYQHALSKEHKRVLFAELYREIKDRFGVSSYKDVKRKEMQTVIKYLESWIPKKVINGQRLG